jgi:hypothetical protein
MNHVLIIVKKVVSPVAFAAAPFVTARTQGPADLATLLSPLFGAPRQQGWPRGVQEEESRPWQFQVRPGWTMRDNPVRPEIRNYETIVTEPGSLRRSEQTR